MSDRELVICACGCGTVVIANGGPTQELTMTVDVKYFAPGHERTSRLRRLWVVWAALAPVVFQLWVVTYGRGAWVWE